MIIYILLLILIRNNYNIADGKLWYFPNLVPVLFWF